MRLDKAIEMAKNQRKKLLDEKKLSLILDLDQTVIHATNVMSAPYVSQWVADSEASTLTPSKNIQTNRHYDKIHTFTLPNSPILYYVKLRPYVKEFLDSVSKLFELTIYTLGT